MKGSRFFKQTGVHCIVDGQFGSTGKGALSAWLARQALKEGLPAYFSGTIYSGGPNSGHTFYHEDQPVVLKQLPTFSVAMMLYGRATVPAFLSAGAIIDREILREEALRYPNLPIFVHPNAAIITDEDREAEKVWPIVRVAGTGSGTGAALMRKISRDPKSIARNSLGNIASNVMIADGRYKSEDTAYVMEVSQGFSLGINSQFYPKVTSRECTVMQGMADARIPARDLAMTFMAIRTFPIRVGNVDGHSSGDWYPDQFETTWEELRVPPEITTVTKRIRRVASFSYQQLWEAIYVNAPDYLFVSHVDYLHVSERSYFLRSLQDVSNLVPHKFGIIKSMGPTPEDVSVWMEKANA